MKNGGRGIGAGLALALALVLVTSSTALAEGEDGFITPQGDYQAQPAQEQPATEAPTAEEGRGIEYGAHLVFPIWLTTDGYSQGFPIGITGRVGWEFGSGFSGGIYLGVVFTAADFDDSPTTSGSIFGLHGGGALRYSIINPSRIVPFGAIGLGIGVYNAQADSSMTDEDSSLHLDANATIGIAYELTAQAAIEVGAQFHALIPISGENDFEENGASATQLFVTPVVGVTLYY